MEVIDRVSLISLDIEFVSNLKVKLRFVCHKVGRGGNFD